MKNRVIAWIVLLIGVFLLGFLPEYRKVKRLEDDLRQIRQENSQLQLRDLAGLAYFHASQKNYGLAAETSTRFFNIVRETASHKPDAGKPLQDLLSSQDKITAELAKGDPGVVNDLQALMLSTREATAASAGAR